MSGIRRWCVEVVNWADDRIIGHRWYWLCDRIFECSWWGPPDEVIDGVETWHTWLWRPSDE